MHKLAINEHSLGGWINEHKLGGWFSQVSDSWERILVKIQSNKRIHKIILTAWKPINEMQCHGVDNIVPPPWQNVIRHQKRFNHHQRWSDQAHDSSCNVYTTCNVHFRPTSSSLIHLSPLSKPWGEFRDALIHVMKNEPCNDRHSAYLKIVPNP